MKKDPVKITKNSYNKIAKDYVDIRDKHFLWCLLSNVYICGNFLRKLPKNKKCKVLVVGPAGGHTTFYMAKKTNHFFQGIDISKEMVRITRKRKKQQKINNCDFKVGDIVKVKLKEKYDGVFCDGSLYHVPKKDLPGLLMKFRKALKPKGFIYANFKRGKGYELQKNTPSFAGHPRAYWFYSKKEIQELFDKTGFRAKVKAPFVVLRGERYIEVFAWPKKRSA